LSVMSRSRRSRTLTALLGLWFVVAGQEPPFPHPCEMGMTGASVSASLAGIDAPVAPDEHAEHLEHARHDATSDDRQSDAPSHDTCECIGDCCCAPAIDWVAAPTLVAAHESASYVLRTPGVARAPSAATRYLLPWANGPPGALI